MAISSKKKENKRKCIWLAEAKKPKAKRNEI